jgi:quercetin dioxygenase-like cupin family protein
MSSLNIAPLLSGHVIGSVNDAFVIAEWRDPGGPPGPPRLIAPRHLHRNDDEAWYVLEGTLCVQVGNEEIEAHAGSAVFVPRRTPHTYWNPGPNPARYLLVMTSNIYRLIPEIHGMKERTPAAFGAVFTKYDSELLDA